MEMMSSFAAGSVRSIPNGLLDEINEGSNLPKTPSGPGYLKFHANCSPITSTTAVPGGGGPQALNQLLSPIANSVTSTPKMTRAAPTVNRFSSRGRTQ